MKNSEKTLDMIVNLCKIQRKSAAPPGNRGLECAALTERGS